MANAIKKISTQRGYDVTEYTLQCFGGAGGQHACDIADTLGMTRIFLHPFAGVLSAYGMGLADIRALREQAVECRLDEEAMADLRARLSELEASAHAEILGQGIAAERVEILPRAHLRYEGTDSAMVVAFGSAAELAERFAEAHRQRYGFVMADKALIVEAVSLEAVGQTDQVEDPDLGADTRSTALTPQGGGPDVCRRGLA